MSRYALKYGGSSKKEVTADVVSLDTDFAIFRNSEKEIVFALPKAQVQTIEKID